MSKKKPQEAPAAPEPMKKSTYRGYTVVQSPRNHHVMVGRDGKVVLHSSYTQPLDKAGLQKVVDDYLKLAERK